MFEYFKGINWHDSDFVLFNYENCTNCEIFDNDLMEMMNNFALPLHKF